MEFDTGKTNIELAEMVVKYLNDTFEGVAMTDSETIEATVAAEVLEARLKEEAA